MKKVLFASTALIATAGVAAAEITFNGSANLGVIYEDIGGATSTVVKNEIDFQIVGSGETDGGLKFGATLDVDGATNNAANSANAADPDVWIEINGLKLLTGLNDAANDNEGLPDVGFDDLGVDDAGEVSGSGSADVVVSYSFGDISVAASADSSGNDWAVGAAGSFSDVSFKVGFGEAAGNDEMNLYLGYTTGAFTVGAQYSENGTNSGWGVHGSYSQGDLTVTAVYSENDNATSATRASEAYGIGVAYSLGGGATIAGGIAQTTTNSVDRTAVDLGMTFKF
ncbi:MAG: porin [Thalassovita sp.]